jgi:type II secretory pathway pseudopilin PulG
MIEMIGVIAIMAIAAAIIMPNFAQRMSRQNGEKEDKMLDVISEGLTRYVQTYQVIPGANTWISGVASMTGLTTNEVRRVLPSDSSTARVYLIHPSFAPSTTSGGTFADPLWTQGTAGASSVTSPRILIISVHKPGLTLPVSSGKASSTSVFDAIWDWTLDPSTEAPPSGWSSSWTGNGEYLHVERINLTPVFQRVTISNSEYPDVVPSYAIGSGSRTDFDSAAAMDVYFIINSLLRFYKDDDNDNQLDISHSLTGTANFIYEGTQWRIP